MRLSEPGSGWRAGEFRPERKPQPRDAVVAAERAGRAGSQDRFESDAVGERGEPDQQHGCRAHPDLRCRVLQAARHTREAHRVLDADGDRRANRREDRSEEAPFRPFGVIRG
jgi:hypothetical protein